MTKLMKLNRLKPQPSVLVLATLRALVGRKAMRQMRTMVVALGPKVRLMSRLILKGSLAPPSSFLPG